MMGCGGEGGQHFAGCPQALAAALDRAQREAPAFAELESVWPADSGTWRLEGPLANGTYAAAAITRKTRSAARAWGPSPAQAIAELIGLIRENEILEDQGQGAARPRPARN